MSEGDRSPRTGITGFYQHSVEGAGNQIEFSTRAGSAKSSPDFKGVLNREINAQ